MPWAIFYLDVFLIWLHGKDPLKEFLIYKYSFHKRIKYIWDYSTSKVSYLGVSIYKEREKHVLKQTEIFYLEIFRHNFSILALGFSLKLI